MFWVIAPIAAIIGGLLVVRVHRHTGRGDLTDLAGVEDSRGSDG
jgi:hypothetical protein